MKNQSLFVLPVAPQAALRSNPIISKSKPGLFRPAPGNPKMALKMKSNMSEDQPKISRKGFLAGFLAAGAVAIGTQFKQEEKLDPKVLKYESQVAIIRDNNDSVPQTPPIDRIPLEELTPQ